METGKREVEEGMRVEDHAEDIIRDPLPLRRSVKIGS